MGFRATGTVMAVGQIAPNEVRQTLNDALEGKMLDALDAANAAERLAGKGVGAFGPHYAVLLLNCDEDTVRALGAWFRRELSVKLELL